MVAKRCVGSSSQVGAFLRCLFFGNVRTSSVGGSRNCDLLGRGAQTPLCENFSNLSCYKDHTLALRRAAWSLLSLVHKSPVSYRLTGGIGEHARACRGRRASG